MKRCIVKPSEFGSDWIQGDAWILKQDGDEYLVEMIHTNWSGWMNAQRLFVD